MRVGILGPVVVWGDDDEQVAIPGARLQALLGWLAVDLGRRVSVSALFERLWPEEQPAPNALQSLVSRLRRVLPDAGVLELMSGGYRLRGDGVTVDAYEFDALVRQGVQALRSGSPASACATLREALGYWRGEVLDGVPTAVGDAFAVRLAALRREALEARLAADLMLGRAADALPEIEGLVAADPTREPVRVLQLRALHAAGRTADALTAYEETRLVLAEQLGADPGVDLRDLHLAILRDDPELGVPRRTAVARDNLPASLTSFVGREDEIALTASRLAESRLVTLVGPGGSGKTRLAIETARWLLDEDLDAVWLIELASVTDPSDIWQAALDTLGLRELRLIERGTGTSRTSPVDAMTRVLETLERQHVLLVVDNCEHLVRAAAEFTERILTRCRDARVLATSREPLAIFGESISGVGPLALPVDDVDAAMAQKSPAVELFVTRAHAARADFVLDEGSLGTVLEICRRLDGLPLALELAAARMRTLTARQIADRLGDRFALLTGGSRTALPRHQTLRAVVDWSWDLLTDLEREVAEVHGVFAGGATAAALAAVCGRPVGDVDEIVTALGEKSLLVFGDRQTSGSAERRSRMLETIREYGLDRLAYRGRLDAVRRAHAMYFRDLAEEGEPLLRGPGQVGQVRRLAVERDNLLSALRYAADTGDADTAVRLGAALTWYWTLSGNHAEAATWLAVADLPGDAPAGARTLIRAGLVLNRFASGLASAEEIDQIDVDDFRRQVAALDLANENPLLSLIDPFIAVMTDLVDEVDVRAEIAVRHPDPWVRPVVRMMSILSRDNAGLLGDDSTEIQTVFEAFASVGDQWGMGVSMHMLAMSEANAGRPEQALDRFARARAYIVSIDSSEAYGQTHAFMAALKAELGRFDEARSDIDSAIENQLRVGTPHGLAEAYYWRAEIERRYGDVGRARADSDLALEHQRSGGFAPPQTLAMILAGRGFLDVSAGQLEAARRTLDEAVDVAEAANDLPVLAIVAVALAGYALAVDAPSAAARLLGLSRNVRGRDDLGSPDLRRVRAAAQAALGDPAFDTAYRDAAGLSRAEALAELATLRTRLAGPYRGEDSR